MFEKYKRSRNSDGTFKNDIKWTPWNDAWEYKMSDDLKDMIERTAWTFIEAFIGALTVAPLVGVDAGTLQLAALAGGGAAQCCVLVVLGASHRNHTLRSARAASRRRGAGACAGNRQSRASACGAMRAWAI